jgi:hypothetical protein
MNLNASRLTRLANTRTWLIAVAVLAVFSLAALPAAASLGGNVDSVQADQAQMKATARVATANAAYTVHEIQTPTGTVVREYVTPGGQVFAVSWRGPARPNLQQLFGSYYDQYVRAAQQAKMQRPGHGPGSIQEPNLVVHSGGRMRFYVGKAYIPQMVPDGVQIDALQ